MWQQTRLDKWTEALVAYADTYFLKTLVSSASSWLSVALSIKTAILSFFGLVLTNKTDLLNSFIGNDKIL